MKKERSDRGGPRTESANDFVGRVSAEGQIQDFGACWQWLDDVEHLRDLVEPHHQARIDKALATAVNDGAAEIDAGFRAGGTPFRWRFQRTGKGLVHVVADPIDPDPVTGHAIAEGVSTGVALSDANGRLQYVNAACAAIWGCSRSDLPGRGLAELFRPQDRAAVIEQHRRTVEDSDEASWGKYEIDRQAGGSRTLQVSTSRLEQPHGVFVLTILADVSGAGIGHDPARRDVQAQENEVADETGDEAEVGRRRELATGRTEILKKIARGDDLVTILYELIGAIEQYGPRLTAAILRLHEGRLHVQAAPGLANECIEAMHQRAPSDIGGPIQAAITHERRDTHGGRPAARSEIEEMAPLALTDAMRAAGYGEVLALPVRDLSGAVLGLLTAFVAERSDTVGAIADMLEEMAQIASIAFEQRSLTDQLVRQAHYDPLTQLPNRTLLDDRLDQLIRDVSRNGGAIGVIMLDLDDFKLINDSFGHATGDDLLQQVASRLEGCLRAGDTVARFGGDEFVIVTPLEDPGQATDIAQRLLAVLQPPFSIKDRSVDARPSIGISLFPQDGLSPEGMLQAADTAMYTAKSAGKNRYHYFSESMNAAVSRRLRIEGELRQALAKRQLELHYQPVIALEDNSVVGAEALIRWLHPEQGLMLPGAFLPVAEQSELVNHIDHYVLECAMAKVAEWQRSGHELLMSLIVTSLNVSARGLHEEGFAARVGRILRASGVEPRCIELEITESMIMRDFDAAVAQLRDLKERAPGLRIAIDDFGTGHASFAYLRQLPVDTLKIDMSFVADLDKPGIAKTARAIVKTIVALGRNLDLTVVAEGVESRAQADFLRSIGCHRAQGFLFSYPLDVASFEQFVT